jgi:hypothetical protein
MAYALDLTEMEAATLLSLVGLAVAVMQNDEEAGRGHIEALSLPGIEAAAKGIVEKCALLFTPNDPAPTLIVEG